MSNELEKRLRELEMRMTAGGGDLPQWARSGLREAARIGADIERREAAERVRALGEKLGAEKHEASALSRVFASIVFNTRGGK